MSVHDDNAARYPHAGRMIGILYVFLAYFFYAISDAAAKWLMAEESVWQLLFLRCVIGLIICVVIAGRTGIKMLLAAPTRWSLLGMNLANFGGWVAYYSAANGLHLSQLYTMYYLSPIIATLLAGPMLKERIGWMSWVATAMGFAGVLVAVPPTGPLPALLPALFGLLAAALWGLASILYRRNVTGNSNTDLIINNNFVMAALSMLPLPWYWSPVSLNGWGIIMIVSIAGLAAHFLYISGIRRVPVAVVGPIGFSSLLWSVILGYTIWGNLPTMGMLIGGAMILSSGVLVFGHDWIMKRPVGEH